MAEQNKDTENLDKEVIGLKSIIVGYLHHWKLFAAAFCLAFVLSIVYLVFYPKTYQIMSVVLLQDEEPLGGSGFGLGEAAGMMKSFGLGAVASSTINMEDELAELTSNSLVTQVVKTLGLNYSYRKPYSFYKEYENVPVVLTLDSASVSPLDSSIEFDIKSSNGKVNVSVESRKTKKQTFNFDSLPARISFAESVFLLDYKDGDTNSFHVIATYMPASWVAEDLINDLLVEERSKISNVVEMTCDDYEKTRAVDVLNKLVELYNKQGLNYKKEESLKLVNFLSSRIDSVTHALSMTEIQISKYKKINKLTSVEADVMFYSEQMKELQLKLIELKAQLNLVSMLDNFVSDPKNKYNMVPALLSIGNEKEGVISSYNTLLLERARVIQNSSMDNPLITTLSKQVDEMRGSVFGTIQNTKEGIRMTMKDLESKESILLAKMGDYPEQEYEYLQMKRQQEIFQGIYLVLLQKREELLMSVGHSKPKARVLDEAFVKAKPIGPRKLFAAIGIILFTLIIPVVYLFSKEQIVSLYSLYKKKN